MFEKKVNNKIKIGVLTLPIGGNYGGVMQAYALISFLQSKGYDATIIKNHTKAKNTKELLHHFADLYINSNILKFVKSNVYQSKKIVNESDYKLLSKKFDYFIVGSDQVWRLECAKDDIDKYFLSFVNNKPKISYAASFGIDNWDCSNGLRSELAAYLAQFNAVSVRENSGINICKYLSCYNAQHVLDPTLLLSKSHYLQLCKEEEVKSKNILSYVLDKNETNERIIEQVGLDCGLPINYAGDREKLRHLLKNFEITKLSKAKKHSIEYWLACFRDAEYVITDSFHGMVFSIIFEKQFVVIGNKKRGLARFESLLNEINLKDRLLIELDLAKVMSTVKQMVNYETVNLKLNLLRQKSEMFLLENVKHKK